MEWPSEIGYWKLNEISGSNECHENWEKNINSSISEVKQYKETMANEKSQNARGEFQIDKITYAKGGLLIMVESRQLWTLKPKLWTSQIWTSKNIFASVLVCAKCLKLITLDENIASVQELSLCYPLFFVFFFEFLNSGIKNCFDAVVFQDAVCEECFSIGLRCLHL